MSKPEERILTVSKNIQLTREECGLSREEMARVLDIPLYVLARYESPQANSLPTEDKLAVLAHFAGVTVAEFEAEELSHITPPDDLEELIENAPPLKGAVEKREPPISAQKRGRRIFRAVCFIIMGAAIVLTIVMKNTEVTLNPNATVVTFEGETLFHVDSCPLITNSKKTSTYYTVEAAYGTGHMPCPECIPKVD